MRCAVLFVNYGPYHVARARALLKVPDLDPIFIQLAAVEKKYSWTSDKSELGARLVTAVDVPYESCSPSVMTKAVVAALGCIRPDSVAIAGYSEPGMRAAANWALHNDARVVLMGDSVEFGYRRYWWREMAKRWWIRRHVNAGFVAGTASKSYMAKLGVPLEQIWTPYDVVDNDFFQCETDKVKKSACALRAELGLPENFILFVGRFVEEKNLDGLLHAYAKHRSNTDMPWSLVLVGDGPLRDHARTVAQELGGKGLVWAGAKLYDELPPYFGLANALILTSRRETWGLVVNEAMASGLPVLVSNKCGSSLDLVRDGWNGFTFSPTVDGICEALQKVSKLSDTERAAMGEASRQLIAEYSPEAWARNLAQALRCQ